MSEELVLIDTSVWIVVLRKSPPALIRKVVERLLLEERVAIIPMVRLELLGGTRTQDEFERLSSRLDALHLIPADEALWKLAAQLSFKLRRRGKSIPSTDIIIGAAAISASALLLHADRHFDLMAENTELKTRSFVSEVNARESQPSTD